MLVDLTDLKSWADADEQRTGGWADARQLKALIAIAERLDRLCDLMEKAQEKWI